MSKYEICIYCEEGKYIEQLTAENEQLKRKLNEVNEFIMYNIEEQRGFVYLHELIDLKKKLEGIE